MKKEYPVFLSLALAICQPAFSLEIRSYAAQRHDRFLDFPSNPSFNPNFRYASTDLTGVGWYLAPSNTTVERRRQYTLVSPKHFIGAYHFRPSTNGQLQFLASDGVVRTYNIESIRPILNSDGDPSDLMLGTLETEVGPSDGINFQPFLSLPDAAYLGQELIFMGHFRSGNPTLRAGRAVIQARSEFGEGAAVGGGTGINRTEAFTWTYQDSNILNPGNPDDSYTEPGDSGSPSLASVDGRGALVGFHTAAGSANLLISSQNISYDTFVPFYINDLNEFMATDGYHMTRAVPGPNQPAADLEVVPGLPGIIRAGYPVTFPVTLTNGAGSDDANNLDFTMTFPPSSDESLSGEGWIFSPEGSSMEGRKGGLEAGGQSVLSVGFTPLSPGTYHSNLSYSADEFGETSEQLQIEVIESYRSWSSGLPDDAETADPDGDGIPNLQEYAFGGDPGQPRLTNESDGGALLPTLEMLPAGLACNFLQRTDATVRGLGYFVEWSPDLSAESWSALSVDPDDVSEMPAGEGFERVRIALADDSMSGFYRIRLELNE